jgi:hypothetical protein
VLCLILVRDLSVVWDYRGVHTAQLVLDRAAGRRGRSWSVPCPGWMGKSGPLWWAPGSAAIRRWRLQRPTMRPQDRRLKVADSECAARFCCRGQLQRDIHRRGCGWWPRYNRPKGLPFLRRRYAPSTAPHLDNSSIYHCLPSVIPPAPQQVHGYLPFGIAWYRKHFTPPATIGKATTMYIDFDGIQTMSQVPIPRSFIPRPTPLVVYL